MSLKILGVFPELLLKKKRDRKNHNPAVVCVVELAMPSDDYYIIIYRPLLLF